MVIEVIGVGGSFQKWEYKKEKGKKIKGKILGDIYLPAKYTKRKLSFI